MATTSQNSLAAKRFILTSVVIVSFLTVLSCGDKQDGKGEWIPVPPDTSALGKIDHFIPVDDIQRYKDQYSRVYDSLESKSKLNFTMSEAFNKPALLEVLKDPRCVGIRIYYGINSVDGKQGFRLVIVGVDEQGKDLYITRGSTLATQGDGGKTGGLEYGQCNPPCEP